MPSVVCFVGRPDSGKTTFLEKLIPCLHRNGYRIGTVKHHIHEFQMDTPGKDTWRHKKAGAERVALSSPTGIGVIRDVDFDTPLDQLVGEYFADMDLVIAEGYKRAFYPKIEIHRLAISDQPLADPDDTWKAYISDAPLAADIPVFSLHQVEEVAAFLIENFIRVQPVKRAVLQVNGRNIPMKPFLEGMIRQAVLGLVSPLKDCQNPQHLTLTIDNATESSAIKRPA